MACKCVLKENDNIDPLKGPKGDTAFLRLNYKFMAPGGVFRTPKAKFPPATIHAEAEKAGWRVKVTDEDPWLKVTVVGKALRKALRRNPDPR
jgi:hypothetical protein